MDRPEPPADVTLPVQGPRRERGRLPGPAAAPERGEATETLAVMGRVVVEAILSGRPAGPAEYLQDQDEWVVLLDGAARLEVDGEPVGLGPGDWILLPAGTPHRLVHTEPGTRWLAVHVHPEAHSG